MTEEPVQWLSLRDQMIANGELIPAEKPFLPFPPPLPAVAPGEPTLTEILLRMRAEERW